MKKYLQSWTAMLARIKNDILKSGHQLEQVLWKQSVLAQKRFYPSPKQCS